MSGRKTVMTRERIKMLQDIGFEWEISSRGFIITKRESAVQMELRHNYTNYLGSSHRGKVIP